MLQPYAAAPGALAERATRRRRSGGERPRPTDDRPTADRRPADRAHRVFSSRRCRCVEAALVSAAAGSRKTRARRSGLGAASPTDRRKFYAGRTDGSIRQRNYDNEIASSAGAARRVAAIDRPGARGLEFESACDQGNTSSFNSLREKFHTREL